MVLKMGPLEDHDHYDEVPMIGLLIFIRRGNERETLPVACVVLSWDPIRKNT